MEIYQSKYTGAEIDEILDIVKQGGGIFRLNLETSKWSELLAAVQNRFIIVLVQDTTNTIIVEASISQDNIITLTTSSGWAYRLEEGENDTIIRNIRNYLKFEAAATNSSIRISSLDDEASLQYSIDEGGSWRDAGLSTYIVLENIGDSVMFKGINLDGHYQSSAGLLRFGGSGHIKVSGNIMSLLYGDNFEGETTLTSLGVFACLFINNTFLVDASDLILPATTLVDYCYYGLFEGCAYLEKAPELPAQTLSLGCYQRMFKACISLKYIKCLATDISAQDCTAGWVEGVLQSAASRTFVKNPDMSNWTTGNNGIPSGWTVVDAD